MKIPHPALAFLFLGFGLPSAASAGLTFEKERLDLKPKAEETKLVTEFPFTNSGEDAVSILDVRSTCGCLSAKADKEEYAPGEKGMITATFDLGRFTGEQEKAITVRTSAKDNGQHRLLVSVEIPKVFVIEPEMLEWIVGEEKTTKTFRVKVPHTDPIRIVTIAPSRENVECELVEHEAGRDYEIRLTPRSTEVPMLGVLKITTDCQIEKHQRQLAFFNIRRGAPTPTPPAAPAVGAKAKEGAK